MRKNIEKYIVLGVCSAAFISMQPAVYAGSSPEQAQIEDMKMTSQEMDFESKLKDDEIESFFQMSHKERAEAIELSKKSGQSPSSAVKMVKDRQAAK